MINEVVMSEFFKTVSEALLDYTIKKNAWGCTCLLTNKYLQICEFESCL